MKIILLTLLCLFTTITWGQNMDSKNINSIKKLFSETGKDNLKPIYEFYHENIEFSDPVGGHKGRANLVKYYENLYQNVEEIRFDFSSFIESGNTVVGIWKMTLKTPKLNGGEAFVVEGNSHVIFDSEGKAIYHRDYFDMGEFIYERIPVIGYLVRKVKSRLKE